MQPAYLWVPEHRSSAGAEAIGLAETVGLVPDPEQRIAIDALLAENSLGKWAAIEGVLIAPRQNLKTFCFIVIALAKLLLFDDELISWSAHLFSTAIEAFRVMESLFTEWDHLRRRVKHINNTNGEEGIELLTGQRIQFRARSRTRGRGLSGDTIFFDEAFAVIAAMIGSLFPTLSARPNPQAIYGSSAGFASSEVLRALRERGRPGGDPTLSYIEWCAEQRPCAVEQCDHRPGVAVGCALDDMDLVRQANPALDRRITRAYIRAERLSMPVREYMRERLGWWEDPEESVDGIALDKWHACADADSEIEDGIVFAVSVAYDLTWSTIAAAGVTDFEFVHGEVVEYRRGTDWVAERLLELRREHGGRIVIEVGGPRCTIADELDALGVEYEECSQKDLVDACGTLNDLIMRRAFRHLSQPELDYAVASARRRLVGDAWTWAMRASPIEISPIKAVTMAVRAVVTADSDDAVGDIY
ncbi:MAG TPA: hypothetical protein VHC63_13390 [Acidimicrobiales bacterium]|nr:hypothetical protein [Acidimicrobiales bacterium]